MSNIHDIRIDQIHSIETSQIRVAGTDPGTVAEYAEAMEAGAVFPAIVVFFDGSAYWPADGYHRIEAAKRIKSQDIAAEIHEGGQREAMLFAVGANASHGMRRTQADKRNAVETLLRDPEWNKWGDREIARQCNVDHKTVAKVRGELTGEIPSDRTITYRDRHGNQSEMRVAGSSSRPIAERLLEKIPDEALIAEVRRRGLEVGDV